ncbi:MAG TPA: universal stress protein [Cyclobacteriaceae bacterium]|nr:universal stress protein [Cyclobacteriaceae bacterium]
MAAYQIKRILVAVDFSGLSLNALETAAAIARRQLATLTLLHIAESRYAVAAPVPGAADAVIGPELLSAANENLSDLARKIRIKHDLVVHHFVQAGDAASEISRWSADRFDLIVMGAKEQPDVWGAFLGSTAYAVVMKSACPVLTVPGTGLYTEFDKVLFPIRPIPHTLDKYDFIKPVIQKNSSSVIVAGIVRKGDEAGFAEMRSLVDYVRARVEEEQVACRTEVHYCTDIAEQVVTMANAESPDLLVITATSEQSWRDYFVGAFTQRIVSRSHCPVLSIRPDLDGGQGVLLRPVMDLLDIPHWQPSLT